MNSEMFNSEMFELDEFQERYLDDLETQEWLDKVIRKLADQYFPGLKQNIQNKDLSDILKKVVEDARQYNFEDDSEILVRYAIHAVNSGVTPMDNPPLAEAIRKSETVFLGIRDQIALSDWAARNEQLFGMEVKWGQ